jgi:hypothetical protein
MCVGAALNGPLQSSAGCGPTVEMRVIGARMSCCTVDGGVAVGSLNGAVVDAVLAAAWLSLPCVSSSCRAKRFVTFARDEVLIDRLP